MTGKVFVKKMLTKENGAPTSPSAEGMGIAEQAETTRWD